MIELIGNTRPSIAEGRLWSIIENFLGGSAGDERRYNDGRCQPAPLAQH